MTFLRFLALVSLMVWAQSLWSLDLYVWTPDATSAPFVIGVREGETPEQAARRYLTAVTADGDLQSLFHGFEMPALELTGFRKLDHSDFKERALIIANRPSDLKPHDTRVESFVRIFRNTKTQSYIVPFAADVGLTAAEGAELVKKLNDEFSAFVAMGGADVDVRLWNQELHPTSLVNTRRDLFEKALITEKVWTIRRSDRGLTGHHRQDRLVGVCRGAQMIARVMGYDLGTHIPDDFRESPLAHGEAYVPHHEGEAAEPGHNVKILSTNHSFLKRLVGGRSEISVNSYHHQYVNWKPGGELQLAAVSPDGVPEAFESQNGAILLMQFHPELMAVRSRGELQLLGEQIMRGVIDFLTPLRTPETCEALLQ